MQSSGSYPHFDGALPSNTRDSHPAGSLLYNMQNLPSSGTDHLTIIPIPPSARLGNPRQPIHTPIYLHDPLLPIQAHSHPYGPKLPMANPWPENSQLATPPYSNFSTATSSVSTPGQATPEEQSQEALREHWRCWVRARSTLSCVFEMLPSVPLRNRPFITKLYGGLMRTLRQLDLGGWAEATQPEGCVTPPAHPPTLKATVEAAIQQVKALQETAGAARMAARPKLDNSIQQANPVSIAGHETGRSLPQAGTQPGPSNPNGAMHPQNVLPVLPTTIHPRVLRWASPVARRVQPSPTVILAAREATSGSDKASRRKDKAERRKCKAERQKRKAGREKRKAE